MLGCRRSLTLIWSCSGRHFAHAVTMDGEELFARPLANDQADIGAAIDQASGHGRVALVIDMTASVAQLLLSVAGERGVPVAYVTGLQMPRAADLYGDLNDQPLPRRFGCCFSSAGAGHRWPAHPARRSWGPRQTLDTVRVEGCWQGKGSSCEPPWVRE